MELFRKNESKYYWYDFTVRGERYRGSTKETNQTRAQKAAALKLAAAIKGNDPLDRKPPTLREYSKDFLQWVETGRLEADSRRYYRNGWRLLQQTKIAGMRMDQITKDEVEKLQFPGSASNGNNARRTLRRMYSKAKEDKLIFEVPDFALFKEHGRLLRLNDEAERRLSAVADQPLKDIIVVMRDTGMRNARELYCMPGGERGLRCRDDLHPGQQDGVRPPVHPYEQPREADSRGALRGTERGLGVDVAYKGKHIGEGTAYRQWARARQAGGCRRTGPRLSGDHFGSFGSAKTKSESCYERNGPR